MEHTQWAIPGSTRASLDHRSHPDHAGRAGCRRDWPADRATRMDHSALCRALRRDHVPDTVAATVRSLPGAVGTVSDAGIFDGSTEASRARPAHASRQVETNGTDPCRCRLGHYLSAACTRSLLY